MRKSKTEQRILLDTASCCPSIADSFAPELFKALGDPNRLVILADLAQACGPKTVSEIATCCPIDLSVVSRHLRQLRQAGVVEAEKKGREVYYTVRYGELARVLRRMAAAIEACCPTQPEPGA